MMADRARRAMGLIQRFHEVRNDLEKQAALDQINALYRPDIECRYQKEFGLAVFTKNHSRLPRTLFLHASVIIEVDASGVGTLQKCRAGLAIPGQRMTAVDVAQVYQFPLQVPEGLRLTRWAAIEQSLEEDWT